jgi:hypothetical protein
MMPRNAEPFIAARDLLLRLHTDYDAISGKIRRAELRQQEKARRRDGVRGPAEFWEEGFPELAGRSPARIGT